MRSTSLCLVAAQQTRVSAGALAAFWAGLVLTGAVAIGEEYARDIAQLIHAEAGRVTGDDVQSVAKALVAAQCGQCKDSTLQHGLPQAAAHVPALARWSAVHVRHCTDKLHEPHRGSYQNSLQVKLMEAMSCATSAMSR